MSGYVKLFGSLLHSTVWREDDTTRLVWITMLVMADKDGVVEASVPGLADAARVPLDACEAALTALQTPDRYSRTPDDEGRRIAPLEGVGWQLLNHGKYRAKLGADERREYNAQKKREQREREKSAAVNDTSALSAQSRSRSRSRSRSKKDQERAPTLDGFATFWEVYPRKVGKAAAIKAWQKLQKVTIPDIEAIRAAVLSQAQSPQWQDDGGRYIPHASTWLNGRRWEDESQPASKVQTSYAKHYVLDDWWADCKAKHGGACAGRMAHGIQLDLDTAREEQTHATT